MSDETKEKLRQANLGKKQSLETIQKRAKSLIVKKKKRTLAEKQYLREINLGKVTPQEVKDEQSIAMSLHYKEHKRVYSKVCCLKCKKEISFNRVNVHQKGTRCL